MKRIMLALGTLVMAYGSHANADDTRTIGSFYGYCKADLPRRRECSAKTTCWSMLVFSE